MPTTRQALRWGPILLIVALLAVVNVVDRHNDEDYTPLLVAARADARAAGEPVSVLTERQVGRWDCCGGPRWPVAQRLSAPGNAWFADAVRRIDEAIDRQEGLNSADTTADLTCLYWPVVPSRGDPLSAATSVHTSCYLHTNPRSMEYASSTTTTHWD